MSMRRTMPLLAAGTVLAGALALAPTTAGGQTAACDQPYSPLATAATYPEQESLPEVDAAVVSTSFDRSQNPIDMDGDGIDDTQLVDPFTNDVRITRGDGVLDLDTGGADIVAIDGLGDLDGDGRDELGVQVFGGSDPGAYVVPGTTAVGPASVASAAILVHTDGEPVGIGDGSDRLLLVRYDGTEPVTDVLPASTVLAVGPGGDATGVPADATEPGEPVAHADLGGPGDVVLTVRRTLDSSVVTVMGDGLVRLTTAPDPYLTPDGGNGSVEVLVGPDGAFVTLSNGSRSGARAWMWSLDRPCGPLVLDDGTPPAPAPPAPAPAAEPVAAEADFTG